jgi:hypothetical protein
VGLTARIALVTFLAAPPLAACVEDVVLPDQQITAECGNGVVEPGEECDVASAGCVACVVAPTWSCTQESCTPFCGDGVIGEGATCASPRREDACAMTGYWAARQTLFLRDPILGGLQVSSSWFFFRLEQEGDTFHVRESLDCGLVVTGSATVRYTRESLRSVLHAGAMDGSTGLTARRGTSRAVPGGCAVSFDRWYAVRGVSDAYLPSDFLEKPELASLPALPEVHDPAASTHFPEGATDPDGDGKPGLAFQIEGLASGIRNSAQRDWKEFATPSGASVVAGAMSFALPGSFDLQENVLRVSDCGSSCGLLRSVARIAHDLPPRIVFSYVGRDLEGVRVRQVARDAPRADVERDLATCANVRLFLPHDPAGR